MSVIFYMMINTKYSRALGDYILEFIGLRSWTGDYSGTHLTVIYLGILFITGLYMVEKYAVIGVGFRRKNVLLIFIVLMTLFTSITGITARSVKKNSSGLLAIGYNSEGSRMSYKYEYGKFVEFRAQFELTNYSNLNKKFHLSIDSPFYREEGIEEISFFSSSGEEVIFELKNNETKTFRLSLDNYSISGGRRFNNISENGGI